MLRDPRSPPGVIAHSACHFAHLVGGVKNKVDLTRASFRGVLAILFRDRCIGRVFLGLLLPAAFRALPGERGRGLFGCGLVQFVAFVGHECHQLRGDIVFDGAAGYAW